MKSIKIIPMLLALALSLSGCTLPMGDELLAAPKPSSNYQTLQTELEGLLASGAAYTAPTGGENRSTIQLVDLDGDGADEAIAFFRGSSSLTSNVFEVYIYKKQESGYVCTGSIEGKGTAILSVEYPVITASGCRGMAITWELPGDGVDALTMCSFDQACTPGVLLETEFSAMKLADLTDDGANDLLLITNNQEGKRVARLYCYGSGGLELKGESATGAEAVSVERMISGRVMNEQPAIFAEEKTTGGVGLTTDIFVYADGSLQNLAMDSEASINRGTYRQVSVYAADVNNDGITELPSAVLMAGYKDAAAADALYMIDWYAYGVNVAPELVKTTYQNVSDGWSLSLDDAWHDKITAVKTSDNGLNKVEFAEINEQGQQIPLFTIYCASGTMRDYFIDRSDIIQLDKTSKAVYFARMEEKTADTAIQIDAAGLKNRFSLIKQEWKN